jgi:hypothetical protein
MNQSGTALVDTLKEGMKIRVSFSTGTGSDKGEENERLTG